MRLYRAFAWDGISLGAEEGGPLYVSRSRQGAGRHDNPELYGAYYCSLLSVSCVAEAIQPFRGQILSSEDLQRGSRRLALAALDLASGQEVIDLDDPSELGRRRFRPSGVATFNRTVTQALAASLFEEEGIAGIRWWSVLEASWINCTLFKERIEGKLQLREGPVTLQLQDPDVIYAAASLGVLLP